MKQIKISPESWILIAIGTADLVTTILWIRQGAAQEANPLFKYYWNHGLLAFIAAKYVCLLGPILILEWARRHKPRFVRWALRAAVLGYVGLYGLGVVKINSTDVQAQPHEPRLEVTPVVVHSQNGKTHIVLRGLPDEYYAVPSPREQLKERQSMYPRLAAYHSAPLVFYLPVPSGPAR